MHSIACLLMVFLLAVPAAAQTPATPTAPPGPTAQTPKGAPADPDALRSRLEARKQQLDSQYKALVELEAEIARMRQALKPGEATAPIDAKLFQLKAKEAAYEKDKNAYEIEATHYRSLTRTEAGTPPDPITAAPPAKGQGQPDPLREQARLEAQHETLEKERLALTAEKEALDKDKDLTTKNSAKARDYQKKSEAFNEKVAAFTQKRQQYLDALAAHNARVAQDRQAMAATAAEAPQAVAPSGTQAVSPPSATPPMAPPAATASAPARQPAQAAAASAADTRRQLDAQGKQLDSELQALMKEKNEVEGLVKEAKTPQEGQAANYRAFELNEKIKDFEKRRSAFNAQAEANNAAKAPAKP